MVIQLISVGPHIISNPIFLAPMAGITDLPTRYIVEKFGIGLCFSEMVNADYLNKEGSNSLTRLFRCKNNSKSIFAAQLVGNKVKDLDIACRIACQSGVDIIDFNLGCPVKKVTNGYGGSALLKDIELVKRLLDTIVNASTVPVTVKCRLGWDENSFSADQLVDYAGQAGVSLVSIHARTRSQFFKGRADWKKVRRITRVAKIPIIINGDILDEQSAKNALIDSGCDGIMIGRGLMGKPWLVSQLAKSVFEINISNPSGYKKINKVNILKEHVDLIYSFYGNDIGNLRARKHIKWYLENFIVTSAFRKEILNCKNIKKLFYLFDMLEEKDLKLKVINSACQS